tara:strand:- start:383 stop:757 length:375 start_codon:yes stop_codon:yes gene_type:complete
MWHYVSMKKILTTVFLIFLCFEAKADYMQDLQISNDLLAFSEYGGKTNWSISDLNYLENKVSQFSDQTLKQVWIANIITYSLIGDGMSMQPSKDRCNIAKRNISKLNDRDLKSLWNTNYNLYGC